MGILQACSLYELKSRRQRSRGRCRDQVPKTQAGPEMWLSLPSSLIKLLSCRQRRGWRCTPGGC